MGDKQIPCLAVPVLSNLVSCFSFVFLQWTWEMWLLILSVSPWSCGVQWILVGFSTVLHMWQKLSSRIVIRGAKSIKWSDFFFLLFQIPSRKQEFFCRRSLLSCFCLLKLPLIEHYLLRTWSHLFLILFSAKSIWPEKTIWQWATLFVPPAFQAGERVIKGKKQIGLTVLVMLAVC